MVAVSNFIDFDFTKDKRYVQGYSPAYKPRICAGKFEDSFDVIPEKDWQGECERLKAGVGLASLVTRVYNQESEGSCVGNAGGQALEVLQAKTVGRDLVVPISACSIYKQIGSSPNSGASVDDCIDRLNDTGALPLNTPENMKRFKHTMSHTGFRQAWPSGWKDTAILFSGLEGYVCRSVYEMVSALFRGMCVQVGRAGHSILYLEPVWDGGLFIDYVNSWGQWGFGKGFFQYGFGRDSRRYYAESADWCYAFQAPDSSRWNHLYSTAA